MDGIVIGHRSSKSTFCANKSKSSIPDFPSRNHDSLIAASEVPSVRLERRRLLDKLRPLGPASVWGQPLRKIDDDFTSRSDRWHFDNRLRGTRESEGACEGGGSSWTTNDNALLRAASVLE